MNFQSQDFCIIKGDLVALISCKNSNQSFIVDSHSLINPKTQYNSKTNLTERVFKYQKVEYNISFDDIEQVYAKRGVLTFTYIDSSSMGQISKGFFYHNASIMNEYTKFDNIKVQKFFFDSRTMITNYQDKNDYIEASSFRINSSVGYYAYIPQANIKCFDIYRDKYDNYTIYIGQVIALKRTSILQYNYSTEVVMFDQMYNQYKLDYRNYQQICSDDLIATEAFLIVVCMKMKMFYIVMRSTVRILMEIYLPQNLTFTELYFNKNLRSDFFCVISRQGHNFLLYTATNVTSTIRVVDITSSNGTKGKLHFTETKTNYLLYMTEMINNLGSSSYYQSSSVIIYQSSKEFTLSKLLGNYLLKTNKNSSQFYSYMQFCFYDQKLVDKQCVQCPEGQYSLNLNIPRCYDCGEYLDLNQLQAEKLKFLCQNKMPAISQARNYYSDNFIQSSNLFQLNPHPPVSVSVNEDSGLQKWEIVLIVIFPCFSIPFFCFAACKLRRRCKQQNRRAVNPQPNRQIQNIQVRNNAINIFDFGLDRINQFVQLKKEKLELIKNLAPEFQYNSLQENGYHQISCGICLSEYTSKDIIRETQCKHLFHSNCILEWAQNQLNKFEYQIQDPLCPYCKSSLLQVINKILKKQELDDSEQQRHYQSQQFMLGIESDRTNLQSFNSPHLSQIPNNISQNHQQLIDQNIAGHDDSSQIRDHQAQQLSQNEDPRLNDLQDLVMGQNCHFNNQEQLNNVLDEDSKVIGNEINFQVVQQELQNMNMSTNANQDHHIESNLNSAQIMSPASRSSLLSNQ